MRASSAWATCHRCRYVARSPPLRARTSSSGSPPPYSRVTSVPAAASTTATRARSKSHSRRSRRPPAATTSAVAAYRAPSHGRKRSIRAVSSRFLRPLPTRPKSAADRAAWSVLLPASFGPCTTVSPGPKRNSRPARRPKPCRWTDSICTEHLGMPVQRPQPGERSLARRGIVALKQPRDETAADRALAGYGLKIVGRAGAVDDDELLEAFTEPLRERLDVDRASRSDLAVEDQAQACARLACGLGRHQRLDVGRAGRARRGHAPLDVPAGRDRHVPRGDAGRRDRDDRGAVVAVPLAPPERLGAAGVAEPAVVVAVVEVPEEDARDVGRLELRARHRAVPALVGPALARERG